MADTGSTPGAGAGPAPGRAAFQVPEPGGHLDQMLRQTRAHHVQLSSMGDVKASLLLTTSAVLTPLLLRFGEDPRLRYPAAVMIVFSLLTVLLAAYATMPKFGRRRRRPGSIQPNLLFFADFVDLPYEAWRDRMQEAMSDASRAYETMLREIHSMGVYLARRKYRYIRLAYVTFIGGVVCSSGLWVVLMLLGI